MNLGDVRLADLAVHFRNLFDRRNTAFIDGLGKRVNWLNLAAGDLQNSIRKYPGEAQVSRDLGRFVGWVCCVANHFAHLPLEKAMAKKFPASGCAYCGHKPCACGPDRPEPNLALATPEQEIWSTREWQAHLASVYGPNNIKKGLDVAIGRLFKEIAEIIDLQMGVYDLDLSVEEVEMEFAKEIADVFSWACAIATILGLDLGDSMKKYSTCCPECHKLPCICGRFIVEQGRLGRFLPRSVRSNSRSA